MDPQFPRQTGGIRLDIDEAGIALVRIDRAARRNALTKALWEELGDTFERLGGDARVRVIVLTGTETSFCAGADIGEFATVRADAAQARDYERAYEGCCDKMEAAPKPTIAAVNGFCMGGGCNVAMSCDFRFAVPEASFAIPAAKLSIVYGIGGTRRLLSLVGLAHAKRILFSGERFDAARGREIGFVDEIAEDVLGAARAFAARLTLCAPLTMSGAKTILNGLAQGPVPREMVSRLMEAAADSADYNEGRAAFAEKRAPRFTGR